MTTQNLTLVNAALQKMHWNEERQKVLAKNIANADTPGYKPEDIKPLDFKQLLKTSSSTGSISAATTNSKHISSGGDSTSSGKVLAGKQKSPYETSPSGNSVILEEQLLMMNQNYTDHRLSATIYQKTMDMLKKSAK